ncbi:hypothetical protein E2C01_091405 [Portunus trituberculatus]|uniref:Uncharacterized protein n=1 Tax=Portunus trituberculatus TaxID=210409 RepID=A0A5B7JNZ3_PORTR|nr:hypothetical protein [Portunus trituberculatus]
MHHPHHQAHTRTKKRHRMNRLPSTPGTDIRASLSLQGPSSPSHDDHKIKEGCSWPLIHHLS